MTHAALLGVAVVVSVTVGIILWIQASHTHRVLTKVSTNELHHVDSKLNQIIGGVDQLGRKIDEQGRLLHRHIADDVAHGRRRLDA